MGSGTHNRINAFDFRDDYVFGHYFDGGAIFRELRDYYHSEEFRFEIPAEDFEEVSAILADHGYEIQVIEDPEPFCVVVEQYEPHADVLRTCVAHWTRRGHEFFLLPHEAAVYEAVKNGATPVEETDLVAGI